MPSVSAAPRFWVYSSESNNWYSTADLPLAPLICCPSNTLASALPYGGSLGGSSASFGGGVGGSLPSVCLANLLMLGPTCSNNESVTSFSTRKPSLTPFCSIELVSTAGVSEIIPTTEGQRHFTVEAGNYFTATEECFEHAWHCLRTLIALSFFMRTTPHVVASLALNVDVPLVSLQMVSELCSPQI